MRSIRSSFGTNDPMKALSGLLIPAPAAAATAAEGAKNTKAPAPANQPPQFLAGLFGGKSAESGGTGIGGIGGGLTSFLGDAMLDLLISELSYTAIDGFFGQILDDKEVLSKVFVDVPDISNLTPSLRKQVVNLSAFLAAIKASGMIIDSSQKDFETAKESYRKVVDMREKATLILGKALYAKDGLEAAQREGQARNQQLLTAEEIEYLAAFRDKKPEGLIKDFAAQNIALNYLRAKDPKAYQDYSLETQEVKSHYGAYLRTATGAGAMVGFSAMFLKSGKKLVEQQGAAGGVALLPLMIQGASELATLAPRLKTVVSASDDVAEGSFRVMRGDEVVKRGIPATKIFGALDEQATNQFKSELINTRGNGYLFGLYKHNPASAGQLADRIVSKEAKGIYAKDYLELENTGDFSFQNALEGKTSAKPKKNLAQALFSYPADTSSTDGQDAVLAKVQKDLQDNLSGYTNSDMRKFMFINSAGNAANPKLQLAQYTIQVDSLGMDGLVDYDAMLTSLAHAKTRSYVDEASDKKAAGAPAKTNRKAK